MAEKATSWALFFIVTLVGTRELSAAPLRDLRGVANQELKVKSDPAAVPPRLVSATVATHSIEAHDPTRPWGLELGFTAQSFRARGRMPLVTLGERSLDRLPGTVMAGLEARWLPFVNASGEHAWGFRVAGSYSGQNVRIAGPSGRDLGRTQLHALAATAFLSQEWRLAASRGWRISLDFGAGHFDLVQTGVSPLVRGRGGLWMGVARAGPSYSWAPVTVSLAYERRVPLTRSWARWEEDAAILGIQYALR